MKFSFFTIFTEQSSTKITTPPPLAMHRYGFTLVELIIVMAIIGVLAAIASPHFKRYTERTKYTAVLQTMRLIEKEIIAFELHYNKLPDNLTELGLGHLEDPWGNPYQYLNFATVKGLGNVRKDHSLVPVNTDYDLYSMGPDGKSQPPFTAKDSRDDIVRANDGAFLGRVSNY